MNLKNRAYMKKAEFKERQTWLPFVDAVGIVLQVLEPVKEAAWDWFREWKKGFCSKAAAVTESFQLNLFEYQGATS